LFKRYGSIAFIIALAGCASESSEDGGDLYGGGDAPADGEGGQGEQGEQDGGNEPGDSAEVDAPLPDPLRVVAVDSVEALRTALDDARPGDLIELRDQTWTLTAPIDITKSGTAEHPIVISAETIGGATIAGAAGFRPSDISHVVVRGFQFRHTAAGSRAIDCKSCANVRFTRNRFELAGTEYSHWLVISGASRDNRIDRNVFINKATNGNFVTIDGTPTQIATNTVIDLNYFANQTWGGENEGECVRVGFSGLKYSKGYTVVERNLFEHCDGDPEIVSIKSSNNTIRFNTFRNNAGALVFRHGHASEASDNFFFNNEGGVRIYGDDHRIVNNYFEANYGTGTRTTIVVGGGSAQDDAALASDGYDASERVLVEHNTLVNNASHVQIGGSSSDSVGASDCTIADNILVGDTGTFARSVREFSSFTWRDNTLSGAAAPGEFPSGSYVRVDAPSLITTDSALTVDDVGPAAP
jgi:poly(beta-D-mannuronate) lyase